MTYVGQQPATTFDSGIQDRFTGLTTNTVTLTYDIAVEEDILVVWNNIVQDKNSYSVGGSGNKTVTLGGTLVSADVVTVYYLNRVMQSVNPTAGSVGITELNVSDGSSGQALTTNGSGTLSFATVSADADNYFASSGLSSKDLGTGLHIKTADSGGDVSTDADELVLENSAGVGMTMLGGTGNDLCINFGDSGDNNIGRIIYANNGNNMMFHTNDAEAMRIASDGDVLIGTASEIHSGGEQLGVNGASSTLPVLTLGVTHTSVFGGVKFRNGNGEIGSVTYNASSVAYNTSSDYRLKENETPITDGITRLKTLKPYRFNFKTDSDETVDGFFAHEVTAVPEAVSGIKDATEKYTDKNGDEQTRIIPQGIDQSKLVPLLTSALQEAIKKIETLETKVTALENK